MTPQEAAESILVLIENGNRNDAYEWLLEMPRRGAFAVIACIFEQHMKQKMEATYDREDLTGDPLIDFFCTRGAYADIREV